MNTKQAFNKLANLINQPSFLIGLALLVALLCAALTYQRLDIAPTDDQHTQATPAPKEPISSTLPIAEIIDLALFGSLKKDQQNVPKQQHIPKTNLKLVLKGTFSHTDSEQAGALIATSKRERAKLYAVDDKLPGNATLKEVHSSHVVLSRGGRLEKLLFLRNITGSTQTADNNDRGNNVASASNSAYEPPQSTTPTAPPAKMSLLEIRSQINNPKSKPVSRDNRAEDSESNIAANKSDISEDYNDEYYDDYDDGYEYDDDYDYEYEEDYDEEEEVPDNPMRTKSLLEIKALMGN